MERTIHTLSGYTFTITLLPHHHIIRYLKETIQNTIHTAIPHQIIYDNDKELNNNDPIPPQDTLLTLLVVSYSLIPDYTTLSNITSQYHIEEKRKEIEITYGPMRHWAFDPSITSLYLLFDNWKDTPPPLDSIVNWDTSHIHNMDYLFRGQTTFNQPIGGWDTSQVKSMVGTFWGCSQFNQDLRYWQIEQTQDMTSLFRDCLLFNQDLTLWQPRRLVRTPNMLSGCYHFKQDKHQIIQSWKPFLTHSIHPNALAIPTDKLIQIKYF